MHIGGIIGAIAATKAMNGKFKPKFGKSAIFGIVFFILLLLLGVLAFVAGIILKEVEPLIGGGIMVVGILYMLPTCPYFQNPNNYYIEFQLDDSLEGLKIFYKGKEVKLLYKVDKEGKIAFIDNLRKTAAISYVDGTRMSKIKKLKIINYFTKWLNDNELISSEITLSYE